MDSPNGPLSCRLHRFGMKWRTPTVEEIRAQVWVALACGARGIVHFIYQSTTTVDGCGIAGLVDAELNPDGDRLAGIAQINSELTRLAPVLSTLRPDSAPAADGPDVLVRGS